MNKKTAIKGILDSGVLDSGVTIGQFLHYVLDELIVEELPDGESDKPVSEVEDPRPIVGLLLRILPE